MHQLTGGRVPELDGLRGCAILLVLIFHFGYGIPGPAPGTFFAYVLAPFVRLGWSGVDLFFVLSGYLITISLAQLRSHRDWLRVFYLRRAARVLPLYAVMLTLFLIGVAAQSTGLIELPRLFGDHRQLWTYFTFAQNDYYALANADYNWISVSWSLAIEEKFYLVFPLLIAIGSKRALSIALAATIILSITARTFGGADWQYFFTLCRLDSLAVGAAIALIALRGQLAGISRHRLRLAVALAILGGAILADAKWKGIFGCFTFTVFALFYGAILLAALGFGPINRIPKQGIF